MIELNDVLEGATAAISEEYFLLPIDGDEPVYRERVYCYELYHQMRKLWPTSALHILNGEVDKRGHQLLETFGASNAIPDFLVHRPGNNHLNHAIIEVKRHNFTKDKCLEDLRKISRFMSAGVDYDRGIFLVFGRHARGRIPTIQECLDAVPSPKLIEVWLHLEAGRPAKRCYE